jgi:hypothetical protein
MTTDFNQDLLVLLTGKETELVLVPRDEFKRQPDGAMVFGLATETMFNTILYNMKNIGIYVRKNGRRARLRCTGVEATNRLRLILSQLACAGTRARRTTMIVEEKTSPRKVHPVVMH